MNKLCVVTGSRADYGLLKRTINLISKQDDFGLRIAVTGSHLDETYGNTINEIIADGFTELDRIRIPSCDCTRISMAQSISTAIDYFATYFKDTSPDMLVILGDRYEAFAACTASSVMGIPIAHISGGDVTEGAIDDVFRHCMTKMSTLHFTGCEQSRRRIIQMGEDPKRVFNVGEPGVENALKTEFLSREELRESIDFDGINGDYALITYHPETMKGDGESALFQIDEIISAIKKIQDISFLVTLANADTAGNIINSRWLQAQSKLNNVKVVPSLGVVRYLSAMKYCRFVMGNSSSGIVEAPSFGIPTVNIGSRQKGRMMAKSIISVNADCSEIIDAVYKVLDSDLISMDHQTESPFGDGNTSSLIVGILKEYFSENRIRNKNGFYDIAF